MNIRIKRKLSFMLAILIMLTVLPTNVFAVVSDASKYTPVAKELTIDKCDEIQAIDAIQRIIVGEGVDTDNDGLSDSYETETTKTDPQNPDTDSDGLNDGFEEFISKTNPKKPDMNGDGTTDGDEFWNGKDPNKPIDYKTVRFLPGEYGILEGQTEYKVDPNKNTTLGELKKPTVKVTAKDRVATGWNYADSHVIKTNIDVTPIYTFVKINSIRPSMGMQQADKVTGSFPEVPLAGSKIYVVINGTATNIQGTITNDEFSFSKDSLKESGIKHNDKLGARLEEPGRYPTDSTNDITMNLSEGSPWGDYTWIIFPFSRFSVAPPNELTVVENQFTSESNTFEEIGFRNATTFSESYNQLEKFYNITGTNTVADAQAYLRDNPLFTPALFKAFVNNATFTWKEPLNTCELEVNNAVVLVTYEDGSIDEVPIKITVNKTQADDFLPEIEKNITVKKGNEVNLVEKITNIPEGATAEVTKPVDTNMIGEQVGQVTIIFEDGSSKIVDVPVTVKEKLTPIVPIHEVSEVDIVTEVVKVGDIVNLTDNVLNLPQGTTVTQVGTVDTSVAGDYTGKVQLIFPGGSGRVVEIPVRVECPKCDTAELEKALEDKQKELDELKETTDAKAQELQNQINDLEKQIEDLNNTVANKDELIAQLEADKTALSNQIEALERQLEEAKAEIEELKRQLEKAKAQTETDKEILQNEIDELKKQIADLEGQLEDAKMQAETDKEKIAELEAKIAELEGQLTDKDNQLADKDAEIQRLNKELAGKDAEIQRLKDEIERLNKEIEELKNKIAELEKADGEKDNLIAELQKELEEAKKKLEDCGKANEDKLKQIADLEAQIKDLKKQLEDAKQPKPPVEDPNKDPNADLKEAIIRLIQKAGRELDRNRDLTREQQRALEDAIDDAKYVINNPRSDRQDLREAKRNLEDALDKATKKPTGTTTNTSITDKLNSTKNNTNKFLSNKDNNITDFIDRVRKNIGKDKVISEITSNAKEYTTLKYVFMINSYRFAEATNKDHTIYSMDVAPFIHNDRTMMPLRYVGYVLGAEVNWNERTMTASFTKDGITASININDNKIVMSDGRVYEMDSKPTITNGRTMVSLTNVSKVYGITNGDMDDGVDHEIEWNGTDRTVTIFIQR